MHTIGVLDLFSLFGMMVSIFWQGWHRMRDRWHVRDRVTWILERKTISYLYHIYIISISYLYHLTSFPSISFESPFFAMENGKMSFESQVWCWIWTLSPVSIWIDAVWRRHFASPVESSARCVTQTWWLCAGELCKGLYGLHARLVRWFITCY